MSEKKAVANNNDSSGRIFGSWTDIIILCIAVTPSALLYYEFTKFKKQQAELEARVSKIEQIVYYKNERGEIIPINNLIMGTIADRNINNKAVEQLKKDNAKLIKQIGALSKRLANIEMFLNQSTSSSRTTDISSSKQSNGTQQVRHTKQMFISQPDYEEEEEAEDPEDDFINSINGEVV